MQIAIITARFKCTFGFYFYLFLLMIVYDDLQGLYRKAIELLKAPPIDSECNSLLFRESIDI